MAEAIDKENEVCVKLCFWLRKTEAETKQMLKQAFGGEANRHSQT